MSDQLERLTGAIVAYQERYGSIAQAGKLRDMIAEALRPELEDAERWQVHFRFMDDGRGAAARHQEWIDAARQEGK